MRLSAGAFGRSVSGKEERSTETGMSEYLMTSDSETPQKLANHGTKPHAPTPAVTGVYDRVPMKLDP
ncbi:hypothetical protein E4U42_007543 [Claviceps africana]|uniref:Uncharacterized protein n=1 Tax=Claviceps africana TaxID=83212 RepID=A0A8K0JGS1_9HYPO|nr:hypothetical protein E4U42_007543 [Claviceps africana]